MARFDTDRQKELTPKRIQYAEDRIRALGLDIISMDANKIVFSYRQEAITLYVYSGWYTGRGIKDGRGIDNLIKQLSS